MFFPVTIQKTLPSKSSQIFKFQSSQAVRKYYRQVKVNKMAVVDWITLQSAYPVGIVTGRAWRIFFNYVFAVIRKTLIAQNAIPAMTFIAKFVARGVLLGEINGSVVFLQEILKGRAMRTSRSDRVIAVMTVCTGYDAGG